MAVVLATAPCIGPELARKLAQAVCGDDHLTCSWPDCGCKSTKQKINAVALVVANHYGEIESKIYEALALTSQMRRAEPSDRPMSDKYREGE